MPLFFGIIVLFLITTESYSESYKVNSVVTPRQLQDIRHISVLPPGKEHKHWPKPYDVIQVAQNRKFNGRNNQRNNVFANAETVKKFIYEMITAVERQFLARGLLPIPTNQLPKPDKLFKRLEKKMDEKTRKKLAKKFINKLFKVKDRLIKDMTSHPGYIDPYHILEEYYRRTTKSTSTSTTTTEKTTTTTRKRRHRYSSSTSDSTSDEYETTREEYKEDTTESPQIGESTNEETNEDLSGSSESSSGGDSPK